MNIKRIKNLTATICLIFCAYFLPFFASVSAFSPGFKTITSTVPFLANTDIKKIDQLVSTTIESFSVPGVSIGIIKDEKTLHLKGYGQLNIETKTRINEESIFKVASNSKAFTSAALALFVEVGKLKWSDKVIQYLPEFKMEDLWVTKEFNIRDLLTHRIGLRVGAGYLMLWPEPTLFSRDDVINNLRYFQSVGSFRDEYAYDNLLYIVAGQVIAEISGMSWEMFVEENIFKKLGMKKCFAGGVNTKNHTNLAAPHGIVEDSLILLQKNLMNNKTNLMAAAGGIKCSAKDLLTWVEMLLNLGKSNSSKKLLSEKQVKELWKPVTSLPISSNMRSYDKTDYRSYALGWRVSSYQGEHRVSHTGTLGGFMSQIIMFPTRKLGIVILTNQQSTINNQQSTISIGSKCIS
jgi:CubicO group peptidase (beta-lactamase class C family)